jgi:isoleucyl-tRNA synthetase
MFRPVNSKVDFPKLEISILEFWHTNHIFEKSVESRRGGTRFTLYEGPPTANGNPGIHHVLSRVFKDVIPRFKTMKGYYAPRKAGWDTHGLPVELEIEKKLGFTNKAEIENYGVAKFNAQCRESVYGYLKQWNIITERIGYWLDLQHPYITLDNNYIESCWWTIKQLWDKGFIYQGYKVTPHCPRCGTSLSSHEVALGYQDDTEDPSVYIKFGLTKESIIQSQALNQLVNKDRETLLNKPVFLLAWTTTPWTLPGNTALAISPEAEYAVVEIDTEFLILARVFVESVIQGDNKVLGTIKGNNLVNIRYEPLFNPHEYGVERRRSQDQVTADMDEAKELFELQKLEANLTYRVIDAEFVSMEEGTGIVHIAPAFGEIDFEIGGKKNLDFVQPVNPEGIMTGTYSFAGKFVKNADPLILENLKSRGLLYRSEKIRHTYPFCWRCESPLLYYAKKTWYIRTTAKKKELISGNAKLNWYPEHIKYGRFGDWLENNIDWAFSRERYWGTPLSVWQCTKCGNFECIGSLEELKSKPNCNGLVEPLDLHRPFIDNVVFTCSRCGSEMKRQPEVIDCWFDSGAMPVAQWHYPFENKDLFEQSFPADYICEAVDQTRGWFYSLHALSTLLFDRPCFKNVICLGHILDAEGEKMSKAKGNVVDPWTVLNKYGADAVRWYLLTSSPAGNVRRFSSEMVNDVLRNFLLTVWNTYSFFIMYANIDNFNPKTMNTTPSSDLDIWILSRIHQVLIDVDSALNNYDPTSAGRKIESFVDDLSNWYIRRSRRRFWKSQNDNDKLAAYSTLYSCLVILTKILAPFTPFIADEIYQNLVCSIDKNAPESVHLCGFPVADKNIINNRLIEVTSSIIAICSLGRAARAKAGIKVRQPLSKVLVKAHSKTEKENLRSLTYQIIEELNVKEVEFVDGEAFEEKPGYIIAKEGEYWVAMSTELSLELQAEGTARELVRRLQTMRRSAGLEITDHIIVYYQSTPEVQRVIEKFGDYIKQETLSLKLVSGILTDGAYSEKHQISDTPVLLSIQKETM